MHFILLSNRREMWWRQWRHLCFKRSWMLRIGASKAELPLLLQPSWKALLLVWVLYLVIISIKYSVNSLKCLHWRHIMIILNLKLSWKRSVHLRLEWPSKKIYSQQWKATISQLQFMLKNMMSKISGLASNFSSCELEFLPQTAFDSKSEDYSLRQLHI